MPKVTYGFAQYERETVEYKRAILGAMGSKEIKQIDLAEYIGRSPATMCNYLKDIDRIPFKDLRLMAKKLGLKITIEGK